MIKVYGCPVCGKLTIGSMRTGMNCADCRQPMERLALTFLEYTQMTDEDIVRAMEILDASKDK